ncbi:ATP-dependent DNA helicase [Elysia marginata]|uniref:ATP-dependent DNA helicase n=1 Tax=Elysia marginata TaxID=1093978 RepID=A0AAV4JU00_9GAST|nr:ATP-dependent DNA helicase [Elysia marginata]
MGLLFTLVLTILEYFCLDVKNSHSYGYAGVDEEAEANDDSAKKDCSTLDLAGNKTYELQEIILEEELNILCLIETWLSEAGDENIIADLTPPGFSTRSFPRTGRRGGGVAFVYRSNLTSVVAKDYLAAPHKTFEAASSSFSSGSSQ